MRTPKEVFEDHLAIRHSGHDQIDKDIERNYADDILILSNYGTFKGKDGVRKSAAILKELVPCTNYTYTVKKVSGHAAYLEWTASCPGVEVKDGKDKFIIENDKIKVQLIHYTVNRV